VWRVRALVCDDQSTVHTQLFAPLLACCRVLHVCALLEGLTLQRILDLFFLCHVAGFYVADRAVTLLLLMRRCMKSFDAFL